MANKDKLHVNRYKTLKEHRAAVAARKALQGGKNKGPVANAAAYGETLKKKAAPKAPTSSSKPSKPAAKPTSTKANKEKGSSRFYASSSVGSAGNKQKAKKTFFSSSSVGEYGKKTEQKPVKNRRGRTVGTKTVEKKTEAPKKKRRVNRRGRSY